MSGGGWFKARRATWDQVVSLISGAWPRSVVVDDIERFRSAQAIGHPMPSQKDLADRWGWSRSRVRTILKAGQPSPGVRQPIANQSPGVDQAVATQPPKHADPRTEIANQSPGVRQPIANQSPGVDQGVSDDPLLPLNVEPSETEKETETETETPEQCVWLAWRGMKIPDGTEPHKRARKLTASDAGQIRGRLRDGASVDDLIAVLTYYHQHPDEGWYRESTKIATRLSLNSLMKTKNFDARLATATASRATIGRTWDTDPEFAKIRAAAGKGRAHATRQWPGDSPSMRASRYAAGQLGLLTDYNIKTRTPEIYQAWREACG